MEINISALKGVGLWPFSGSQATHGKNAMADTWKAATSVGLNLLDTLEKVEAFRAHICSMGMDETENMDKEILEGILVQCVAAEFRENGLNSLQDLGTDSQSEEGKECMRVFFGVDGEFYYQAD